MESIGQFSNITMLKGFTDELDIFEVIIFS